MGVPEVDEIDGLPPAVALQQQRGSPTTRSSVGSVTTLSNLLRMLYSRAGDYPRGQAHLDAEAFSPNTPGGRLPASATGSGGSTTSTERSMVPDDSLTIRERAIAAWPTGVARPEPARHPGRRSATTSIARGASCRRRTATGSSSPTSSRTVPVYAGYTPAEVRRALKRKEEPSYMGTFTGAKRYVLHTFANTESASMKKRVSQYMVSSECPLCQRQAAAPRVAVGEVRGARHRRDVARCRSKRLATIVAAVRRGHGAGREELAARASGEGGRGAAHRARISWRGSRCCSISGLGYLSLERSTPTLSPGELQRLRLATQVRSNLFGVVYVLDEPSAGLHPRRHRGAAAWRSTG